MIIALNQLIHIYQGTYQVFVRDGDLHIRVMLIISQPAALVFTVPYTNDRQVLFDTLAQFEIEGRIDSRWRYAFDESLVAS